MTNGGGSPHEGQKEVSPKAKAPAKPKKPASKPVKAGRR